MSHAISADMESTLTERSASPGCSNPAMALVNPANPDPGTGACCGSGAPTGGVKLKYSAPLATPCVAGAVADTSGETDHPDVVVRVDCRRGLLVALLLPLLQC